jgi:hypothetical protein
MAASRTTPTWVEARVRVRPARSPVAWACDQTLTFNRTFVRMLVRHADALFVVGLALLTILAEWPLLHGRVIAGLDSLTQFYPWYELVGEMLRAGRLPGWNPYSLAGAPLAGNPLSGWTYLPAMLAFTTLPLGAAAVAYQLMHVLLATLATYTLARVLGLRGAGAAAAAIAYGQSGLITSEAACCFAFASVGAWLPVLLLGSELAMRSRGWDWRIRGWALAALALSQILASWLGQGSYYALLAFGGFVLFRVVVRTLRGSDERANRVHRLVRTLGQLALHGTVPVVLGVGLAAAGVLPRTEFNLLSSLAGGYGEADQRVGGWSIAEWSALIQPGYWYVGLSIVGLALAALWLARRTPLTWYLLAFGATILVLAMPGPTPLHDLFGLLPGFARLHPHLPDRIVTVMLLVPALLAGLALDRLTRHRVMQGRRFGWLIAALCIGVVFADLRLAREQTFANYGEAEGVHRLMPVDLDGYYTPLPSARFLQAQFLDRGPFRYIGYGPVASGLAYTQRYSEPSALRIGVNNRAVSDRLLDVQGYDAIHLARFDAYLRTANGRGQNYHNADVFGPGLRSPLLDLLAVQYVVTPVGSDAAGVGTPLADARFTPVFDDGQTRVLRNGSALPWAWVVHEARAATAPEALDLLDRGIVDPHRTVLLEPPLRSPLDLGTLLELVTGASSFVQDKPTALATSGSAHADGPDAVDVLTFEADRLLLHTQTDADGVLVLSEVAYPGWVATIDGSRVPVFVANGLFRAVSLPAGQHQVELRFASPTLWGGLVISLLTGLLLVCGCLVPLAVGRAFRHKTRRADPEELRA